MWVSVEENRLMHKSILFIGWLRNKYYINVKWLELDII
jgi:hypothetical protein